MKEIDLAQIKEKSVKGVVALTSRTFVLQIIALISTFILTVLLDPATFGVFYVVTAIVNFLNYFSDIGLAAALIQKKEPPTQDDLASTFTIQQFLVSTAVVTALLLSGTLARFYGLDTNGLWLFRSLAVAFFLSSLKTIPSVILERKLEFQKLVIPQIAETVAFYVVAIVMAVNGRGVASFAWAAIFRGVVGTALLYFIAPWQPQLLLKKESIKKLLTFGLPYQTNSFLALIKDDLLMVFLGKMLPFSAIGYIGWAKKWAEVALRLIMDNIIKVSFPTYSRLQHDASLLSKAIAKSLLFLSLLSFPIAAGMLFMVGPLIEVVPRYSKWEPAMLSFYLFTISSVLATISSPLVNALNATGKVKITFYLMLMWTALTWVLVPLFVVKIGFNGVAVASVLIGLTSFLPYFVVRRQIKISFWSILIKPIVTTLSMAIALIGIFSMVYEPQIRLLLGIPIAMVVYVVSSYTLMGKDLMPYLQLFTKKQKNP